MTTNNTSNRSPIDSKRAALGNIDRKIEALELWLREGIPWEYDGSGKLLRDDEGNRISIYVPNSLRSFNSWSSEMYTQVTLEKNPSMSSISRNGTDTLNKYPEKKTRTVSLIKNLTELLNKQKGLEPTHQVSALKASVIRLNLFIDNQTSKIIELQRRNIELKKILTTSERREKGNFEELTKNYNDLDNQNRKLREEISLLTKQIRNIHALRNVKSDN